MVASQGALQSIARCYCKQMQRLLQKVVAARTDTFWFTSVITQNHKNTMCFPSQMDCGGFQKCCIMQAQSNVPQHGLSKRQYKTSVILHIYCRSRGLKINPKTVSSCSYSFKLIYQKSSDGHPEAPWGPRIAQTDLRISVNEAGIMQHLKHINSQAFPPPVFYEFLTNAMTYVLLHLAIYN